MTRKELYENKLQMDYFSDNYIRFEEDFQKYLSLIHISEPTRHFKRSRMPSSA